MEACLSCPVEGVHAPCDCRSWQRWPQRTRTSVAPRHGFDLRWHSHSRNCNCLLTPGDRANISSASNIPLPCCSQMRQRLTRRQLLLVLLHFSSSQLVVLGIARLLWCRRQGHPLAQHPIKRDRKICSCSAACAPDLQQAAVTAAILLASVPGKFWLRVIIIDGSCAI